MKLVLGILLVGRLGAAAYACIDSGDPQRINKTLIGRGAEAILCPNAVFNLMAPIRFTAPDQKLYTEGKPRGDSRALLRVNNRNLANAVDGSEQSGVELSHVRIDGGRSRLGYDRSPQLAERALIEMGGNASAQHVEWVKAGDPRGAAVLYFGGGDNPGCANALVSHNDFGPSGHPGWPGDEDASWADGISFACTHSEVSDNTVTDATDGAIVIWGCSGSRFLRNHIKAVTRQAFGGINLVDYDGTDGNFRGVIVDANTIEALSAPIRVAIGMGPLIWFCADPNPSHRYNRGATITNNQLLGTHMGYGFAVAGVRDWVIRGNVDRSRHTGKPHQLCDQIPSIPTGFQQQSEYVESSKLQAEYVNGKLEGLIALCDPGDLNMDGKINAQDIQLLAAMASNPAKWEPCRGDLNGDGVIDQKDLDELACRMAHNWPPARSYSEPETFCLRPAPQE